MDTREYFDIEDEKLQADRRFERISRVYERTLSVSIRSIFNIDDWRSG